ncbi:hypothetical protein [Marinovum sp.]|uniref:hypothetical protein n=1 Tax=Marinovum sp. TaxID=2024839 RepID=UPI002B278486|nr:hypothetical protein [Marinovum sp.]
MSNSKEPKPEETEDKLADDTLSSDTDRISSAGAETPAGDDTSPSAEADSPGAGDDSLGAEADTPFEPESRTGPDTLSGTDTLAPADTDEVTDGGVETADPLADPDPVQAEMAADESHADAGNEPAPELFDDAGPAPADVEADSHTPAEPRDPAPVTPPVTEKVVERRGGFVPMVLGGIVAAGLGYGAAYYLGQDDSFETETRAALEAQSGRLDGVSQQITTISADVTERIDGLAADLTSTQEAVGATEGELGAQNERLTSVEALREDLAALDERLTTLAKRPIADTVSREAIAAYEAELERLRGSMEEQRVAIEETIAAEKVKIEQIAQEATQMEERALEEARISAARTVLTQVLTALETGEPFEAALAELAETVEDEMPALQAAAAEGVVTQAALRERFPDDARAALRASREAGADGEEAGIGGVLEKMFEVRSVAPRDGVDTDAILSRAEAAVRNGNFRVALDELTALPEEAKAPLAEWVADAEARMAALDEANAVAARLNQG